MGYTVTVLIYVPLDYQGKLQEHCEAFEWEGRKATVLPLNTRDAGGGKVFGPSIFAGGFNYLPRSEFIDHLATFDWPYPRETVVISQGEDEYVDVWRPEGWDAPKGYME